MKNLTTTKQLDNDNDFLLANMQNTLNALKLG